MADVTARLAELVATGSPVGDAGLDVNATRAVLDSVGVIAAGRTSDAGRAMTRWAAASTRVASPVEEWWEMPRATLPELAAMVNSTRGHALDFDDVLPGAGHPSCILVSAILAAPVDDLSGRRVLDAFIIGYEVNARLAKAVGHEHYRHGWHTTYTIGGFGAAAALATLMNLDASATRRAFGIVASLAGGLQRNFGTMTKPLHSGLAARNGLLAVQLALAGMTSDESILDGERGFLDVYSAGAARPDALDDLGTRWAIANPGPTLKKFACALEVYRAVEGVLVLREAHDIDPSEVVAVRCVVPPGTLGPLRYGQPSNGLEAKFSLPYTVASALVDGELTLRAFADDAVGRSAVRAMMGVVTVHEDVRCRPEDPTGRDSSASFGGFVDVEIQTASGKCYATVVRDVLGSPQKPLTEHEQEAKFLECIAVGEYDTDAAPRLFKELSQLSSLHDVRASLRVLSTSPAKGSL